MIAAVFGPSGSDRRMYSLFTLAVLLAPVGVLIARISLPGAPLLSNIIVGSLMAALVVCTMITLYSTARMVYQGLEDISRSRRDDDNWNNELDLDTNAPAGSLSA